MLGIHALSPLLQETLLPSGLPDLNHIVLSPSPSFIGVHRNFVPIPTNLGPCTRSERHDCLWIGDFPDRDEGNGWKMRRARKKRKKTLDFGLKKKEWCFWRGVALANWIWNRPGQIILFYFTDESIQHFTFCFFLPFLCFNFLTQS